MDHIGNGYCELLLQLIHLQLRDRLIISINPGFGYLERLLRLYHLQICDKLIRNGTFRKRLLVWNWYFSLLFYDYVTNQFKSCTQISQTKLQITGHGLFRNKLHRMGLDDGYILRSNCSRWEESACHLLFASKISEVIWTILRNLVGGSHIASQRSLKT